MEERRNSGRDLQTLVEGHLNVVYQTDSIIQNGLSYLTERQRHVVQGIFKCRSTALETACSSYKIDPLVEIEYVFKPVAFEIQ